MADTDDHSSPEESNLPVDHPAGDGARLDAARRSAQEALDETDRAIAKHARYLKESISEIEAMLGASVWRNPFL